MSIQKVEGYLLALFSKSTLVNPMPSLRFLDLQQCAM